MASLKSFSTEPEPERFQRSQNRNTSSERAASPSVASTIDGDEPGGARLEFESEAGGSPDAANYSATPARQDASTRNKSIPRTASTDVFGEVQDEDSLVRGIRSVSVANIQRLDNAAESMTAIELRPRNSNLSGRHQINGVDAQAVLPPTACVFVANLPEPKDDITLEAGLMREFSKYGKCYVKIRRDGRHMPFAFIQYVDEADAQVALTKARGAIICGRACRTEMVKANRVFIIMRKNGHQITVIEARGVLGVYGEMKRAEMMHPTLRDSLGYPATVLVEFVRFDPERDLYQAFKHDDTYTVTPFDVNRQCATTRQSSDEVYLANCERDRRSIYIGDLPPSTEQEELMEMFGEAGDIIKINLVNRPQGGGNGFAAGVKTLAFIEYSQSDMPELAIARFNGAAFKGVKIKVERKVVKDPRSGPTPRNSRNFSAVRRNGNNQGFDSDTPPGMPGSAMRQRSQTFNRHTQQQQQQQGTQSIGPNGEPPQTPQRAMGNRNLTINTSMTPRVPVGANNTAVLPPMGATPGYGYPYGPGPFPSPFMPPSAGYYGTPGQEPQSPWTYYSQFWPQPSPVQGAQMPMDPMALYNAYMLPQLMAQQAAMADPNNVAFIRAVGAQAAPATPAHGAPVAGTTAGTPLASTAEEDEGNARGGTTPTRANPNGADADPTPRKA